MGLATASLVFSFIILSIAYSLEVKTGFVAPLIPRSSPKHPLYNSNASRRDIVREKQRISAERARFFAKQRQGLVPNHGVAPIDQEIIMTYFLGTPPVETLATPDTGSSIIWTQCQPCIKCFKQTKPIFDPKHSRTYQLVACNSEYCSGFACGSRNIGCFYRIEYDDNSTSRGVVSLDTFSLPGNEFDPKYTHPKTIFGCGFNNVDTINDGTSGVVGLRNSSISLPAQIKAGSFSFCKSESGGTIRFGSYSFLVGDKTRLFTDPYGEYQIIMLGIAVGNGTHTENVDVSSDVFKFKVNTPGTGVTVDTGTSYTRLHPKAFNALGRKIGEFMSEYESYQADGWDICYNGNEVVGISVDTMPSVHFLLGNNVTIEFPNDNIWSGKDGEGNICMQMIADEDSFTIIGVEQLTNYNVGFDLKGNALWLDYQVGCVRP